MGLDELRTGLSFLIGPFPPPEIGEVVLGYTASDSPSRESASPTQDGANEDINKRSLRAPSLGLNELRTGLGLSIDPFAPP